MDSHEPGFWQRNRVTIKAISVGILILVLLIPTGFIYELIKERKDRQGEIAAEVSSKWAGSQTVTGPFLIIPYMEEIKDQVGKVLSVKHHAYFLPDELKINGTIHPEVRNRSIYKVVLYRSDLDVKGSFSGDKFSDLGIDRTRLLLNEARLCFGLSDNRGVEDRLTVKWSGVERSFNAGVPKNSLVSQGVSVPVSLDTADFSTPYSFDIQLNLKGSETLFFTPLGKQTEVQLTSPWTSPSFEGRFLPSTKTIDEKGFTANWKILHFNREFPQAWADTDMNIDTSSFGLNLLRPNDAYGKTLRTVKYSLLFISLTFCLYFFLELFQKRAVHPLQYILVGFALCIFYTLLLSVSEYLDYNLAYVIASTATVSLITLYTKSLFVKWNIAIWFGVFLGLLYSFIFTLIQLEDGALLFGSIGLFILLAIVMYYSRKIDWNYTLTKPKPAV